MAGVRPGAASGAASGAERPIFWRPGTSRPAELPSVDREPHREGASVVYNAHSSLSLSQQRRRLPIFDERRSLLWMVEKYATLVVVGHTGCGKTTQIPQYLHEAGWTADGFMVACTQPRRVAATSVAQRVAEEMGGSVGGVVGYAVRFDDAFDAHATRIKYMTDGRLIREMMSDPLLSQCARLSNPPRQPAAPARRASPPAATKGLCAHPTCSADTPP